MEYHAALEFLKRANLIDSMVIIQLVYTLKTHANQYYVLVIDANMYMKVFKNGL